MEGHATNVRKACLKWRRPESLAVDTSSNLDQAHLRTVSTYQAVPRLFKGPIYLSSHGTTGAVKSLLTIMAHNNSMKRPDLLSVKLWAQNALHGGEVNPPPWEWYQYMKLIEAIDALERGIEIPISQITISTANSPQSVQHQEKRPRLMVLACSQDTAQFHPDTPQAE